MLLQEAIGAGIYLLIFGAAMVFTYSFLFYLVLSSLFPKGRLENALRVLILVVLSVLSAVMTTLLLIWLFFGSITYS